MQNFNDFELIITELCSFMYLINLLTQLVMSQHLLNQQFIFCIFLQITSELKEIVCYSKRPIGLLFHALSHETMFFNFIALNGTMTLVIIYQKDRY